MAGTLRSILHVLHLEDDRNDVELVQAALKKSSLPVVVRVARSCVEFLEAIIDPQGFDVILSDNKVPGFDGTAAQEIARERQPGVPFIFVSGYATPEQALKKLQETGAADFVPKSNLQHLADAILKAMRDRQEL